MKFWNRETGEMFNDILSARAPFCSRHTCGVCPMPNLFRADSLPKEILSCHDFCVEFPREAAAIMGYEVVEDEMQIPFVCQRLGIEPEEPFLLHGYPYKNYPPLVWTGGQIRQYSPDGNHGFKLGGRAVCWMMEHPESIEPLRGYTPEEVAFKENKISQVKEANMNKPLKDWTLGEIKAECEKHKQGCEPCPFYHVLDDVSFSSNCKARQLVNKCPDDWDLSESPRWTERDKEDAKALKRMIKNAHHVRRCVEEVSLRLYGKYDDYILTLNSCFAALPPQTEVTLDEIIGGAE